MKIDPKTAARANLNHWKAGQGARIRATRPIEVYRACEYMAQLAAAVRDPLDLSKDELLIAMKRAVCLERRKLHGPLPRTADDFWNQISAIAERWGIKTNREQWTSSTKTEKEAA